VIVGEARSFIVDHAGSKDPAYTVYVSAYLVALKMLAGRELSEAQVRQRLVRRKFESRDIDTAIARLKEAGYIDDARAAAVIAKRETTVRRRGKARVSNRLRAAGIARTVADRAIDQAFKDVDIDALLDASLQRRLRGRTRIEDDKEMQRLYRYLIGQGFEADRVLDTLRKLRT
jgi:regulatory protein